MNLSTIWVLLKELLPLILSIIKAIQGASDKPAAVRGIAKYCDGVGCVPKTRKSR